MGYIYGKQDFSGWDRAQENCFLLTNGLGGYSSLTTAFSARRSDQGLLIAAVKAPNERLSMVHRLSELLRLEDRDEYLSTQTFAYGGQSEDGFRNLTTYTQDPAPCWQYDVSGVRVKRQVAMLWERNTAAVVYTVTNHSGAPCSLEVTPLFKFAPKEEACQQLDRRFVCRGGRITDGKHSLYLRSNGRVTRRDHRWQLLDYPEDAMDGRPEFGLCASCCQVSVTVQPGKTRVLELVFSLEKTDLTGPELVALQTARLEKLRQDCPFRDPTALRLAVAADAFIARRDSTGGKTILAGYPLFSDWGRDTMIALSGCCLSTGRYEDARSILRTFLAYEKDGLVPNLFPEGGMDPMYNTVDAALLLIDCVWQYLQRTDDWDFVREAYPVLERIIAGYRQGTHHSIFMDTDGLISAGGGLDQVTWMDVCVEGILPTPRHGKPVEINAYWYNALKVMEALAPRMGKKPGPYTRLARQVKASFLEKFWVEEGYLKDVLSGTNADTQIRCNQIWAVSMSFPMLSRQQEQAVVDTVRRHLYTPCGLRTLSPQDDEYRGYYGGPQVDRDMAYHQGTVWPFPMGAYYRALLKTGAEEEVRQGLAALESMLREGCVGQLPEIYDGDYPGRGKGCYAQAWSVGELLRVYEALEK